MLASEALLTLESIVTSILKFNDKLMEGNDRSTSMGSIEAVLPTLRSRLGTSSRKILMHNWDNENSENGVKRKVGHLCYVFSRFCQNMFVAVNMILALIAIFALPPELDILQSKKYIFFSQGEIVQRILQIYLGNSESTSDLLHELAFSILPQVLNFLSIVLLYYS